MPSSGGAPLSAAPPLFPVAAPAPPGNVGAPRQNERVTTGRAEREPAERLPVASIEKAVSEVFHLRPAAIIRDLNLLRPIYQQTAAYGHFGRELPDLTWESTDRAADLKSAAGA